MLHERFLFRDGILEVSWTEGGRPTWQPRTFRVDLTLGHHEATRIGAFSAFLEAGTRVTDISPGVSSAWYAEANPDLRGGSCESQELEFGRIPPAPGEVLDFSDAWGRRGFHEESHREEVAHRG